MGNQIRTLSWRRHTLRNRIYRFMKESMIIIVLLSAITVGFYTTGRYENEKCTRPLLVLDSFYQNLQEMNRDIFLYTLGGDESFYYETVERCVQGRTLLKELAEIPAGVSYYREIRDLEETFLDYRQSFDRIYAHSYLCMEMTIASKMVINGCYKETQKRYEAIEGSFQGIYSKLLVYIEQRQREVERKNRICLIDFVFVSLCILIEQGMRMRSLIRKVITPILNLTWSAEEIRSADLSEVRTVEVEETMDDEMKQLLTVYNTMILRIRSQVRKIMENADASERLKNQELENLKILNNLKTSELKVLQMQINPHFLFNTLNMISQTAYMEQADLTRELLDHTGKLLRYTLDNIDRTVTLARELEVLGNYVEIQECRFGERICFLFELDERFHQIRMPSMILQPLVENAITHGLGMKLSDARVQIRTRFLEEEKEGWIEVEDNGVGMTGEELEKILEEMHDREHMDRKIGLSNVYHRLKIFFGDRAEIEIESEPKVRTIVRIRLRDLTEEQLS